MKKILLLLVLAPALALAQETKEDWARFGRYAEANKSLTVKPRAVLLGDSIFDSWASRRPQFFSDNNFVGRGISGQTTSQILVRMMEDVVKLDPEYVVILCGINDIALNAGHAPDVEVAAGNVRAMAEIAKANKIRPLLCTLLPSYIIRWRPEVTDPIEQVCEFNELLAGYARAERIPVVDFFSLFADENGKMPEKYSNDTVHPNVDGYALMEEYLLEFIK